MNDPRISDFLDIIYEMFRNMDPPLNQETYLALLELWLHLEKGRQSEKLWDELYSKDPGQFAEASAAVFPILLSRPSISRSEWAVPRLTPIVDSNPEILLKKNASGYNPLTQCLLDQPADEQILFLVKAYEKYFGKWQGSSSCLFLYLKGTCSDFGLDPSIIQILSRLDTGLSLSNSNGLNGDSLLHFFGHTTIQHLKKPGPNLHELNSCTYLNSAEALRDLLIGNGELLDRNSQDATAFSAILGKIKSQIGYVAFALLCKCGLQNDLWDSLMWYRDRYQQFEGMTLLNFLSEIVKAYEVRESATKSHTIDISLNDKLWASLPAEGNVTQGEAEE